MEEAKKLEKHVFLFGRQLVPTGKLAPAFHFQGVQPIPDVGLEPVGRRVKVGQRRAGVAGLAAAPEGVPGPALLARQELLLLPPGLGVRIPISIDEVDQPESVMLLAGPRTAKETPRVKGLEKLTLDTHRDSGCHHHSWPRQRRRSWCLSVTRSGNCQTPGRTEARAPTGRGRKHASCFPCQSDWPS